MMEHFSCQAVCGWLWDELSPLWTTPIDAHFHHGYRVGVILTLVVLVLVSLLLRFRRFLRRRCREVTRKGENGTLTISASAVADAVETLLADLEGLAITSCRLYRRRTRMTLEIRCRWEAAGGELTTQIEEARRRVLDMLHNTFGLEQITRVDFRLSGVGGKGMPMTPQPDTTPMTPPNL